MKGMLLNCVVILALLLGILIVIGGKKEGFLSRGAYPTSVDNPMMVNSEYPYRAPGGLSNENYSEQWKLYPIWSVGSYKQKILNTGLNHVMEPLPRLIYVAVYIKK
jgi:hypothetical protein